MSDIEIFKNETYHVGITTEKKFWLFDETYKKLVSEKVNNKEKVLKKYKLTTTRTKKTFDRSEYSYLKTKALTTLQSTLLKKCGILKGYTTRNNYIEAYKTNSAWWFCILSEKGAEIPACRCKDLLTGAIQYQKFGLGTYSPGRFKYKNIERDNLYLSIYHPEIKLEKKFWRIRAFFNLPEHPIKLKLAVLNNQLIIDLNQLMKLDMYMISLYVSLFRNAIYFAPKKHDSVISFLEDLAKSEEEHQNKFDKTYFYYSKPLLKRIFTDQNIPVQDSKYQQQADPKQVGFYSFFNSWKNANN